MRTGRVVAVTGGSGFVGRPVVAELLRSGCDVTVLSRTAQPFAGASSVAVDLHDSLAVIRALETIRPTHLIHLAWIARPGEFWESPDNLAWLRSSTSILEAFYATGGRHVVALGSCAEYVSDGRPLAETGAVGPSSLYAACKIACSVAFEGYARNRDLTVAWMRVFYVYGVGEPEQKFLSMAAGKALRGEEIDVRESERRLDFVHVDDVARAVVLASLGEAAGTFNVGCGSGIRVGDAVACVADSVGIPVVVAAGGERSSPDVVADIGRARGVLGWEPRVPFESGVSSLVESIRRQHA